MGCGFLFLSSFLSNKRDFTSELYKMYNHEVFTGRSRANWEQKCVRVYTSLALISCLKPQWKTKGKPFRGYRVQDAELGLGLITNGSRELCLRLTAGKRMGRLPDGLSAPWCAQFASYKHKGNRLAPTALAPSVTNVLWGLTFFKVVWIMGIAWSLHFAAICFIGVFWGNSCEKEPTTAKPKEEKTAGQWCAYLVFS